MSSLILELVTDSGFIKSRHLDDKAGVVSLLGIAKYLVDNNIKPKYTTNFFISNYEEVGMVLVLLFLKRPLNLLL